MRTAMWKMKMGLVRRIKAVVSPVIAWYVRRTTEYIGYEVPPMENRAYPFKERNRGHGKLKVGDEIVVLETTQPGVLGGMFNLVHVGGPNQVEVFMDIRTPIPSTIKNEYAHFNYLRQLIKREQGKDFSPIMVLEEVYSEFGGRVVLKHTNGIDIPFYFDVYRR